VNDCEGRLRTSHDGPWWFRTAAAVVALANLFQVGCSRGDERVDEIPATAMAVPLRGQEFARAGPTPGAVTTGSGVFMAYGGSLYRVDTLSEPRTVGAFPLCNGGIERLEETFYCGKNGAVYAISNRRTVVIPLDQGLRRVFVGPSSRGVAFASADALGLIATAPALVVRQRCVRQAESVVFLHGVFWAADANALVVAGRGRREICVHHAVIDEFRSAPSLTRFGENAVLAAYPGANTAFVVRGDGSETEIRLPFPATGSVAWDKRRKVAWAVLAIRRERQPATFGICRLDPQGRVAMLSVRVAAGGEVTVDAQGRLWISAGYYHSFAVVVIGDRYRARPHKVGRARHRIGEEYGFR
jgi:hypothetical protein